MHSMIIRKDHSLAQRSISGKNSRFEGMRVVPCGRFRMGASGFYADEKPVREVAVAGFWMDQAPVTNRQFAEFVTATGHITQAELAPDPADYPGMDSALAVPASIVFTPPEQLVDLSDGASWWSLVPGASWRQPQGPGYDIADKPDHPVVDVAYGAALAFASWAGKAAPTEEEREYATRGGLEGATYACREELYPHGRRKDCQDFRVWAGIMGRRSPTMSPARSRELCWKMGDGGGLKAAYRGRWARSISIASAWRRL